jgi:hypothetical protein
VLIYVALSEIIPEEFVRTPNPGMKLGALILGFVLINAIQLMDID